MKYSKQHQSIPEVGDKEKRVSNEVIQQTDHPSWIYSWICICGNTEKDSGFYPCRENGQLDHPLDMDWTVKWYLCKKCRRMIDSNTLQVVGQGDKRDYIFDDVDEKRYCLVCKALINFYRFGILYIRKDNRYVCASHTVAEVEAALGRELDAAERELIINKSDVFYLGK